MTEPRSHGRIFNGLQVITSLSLSMFYQSGLRTGHASFKILICYGVVVSNYRFKLSTQIQFEACPRASAN